MSIQAMPPDFIDALSGLQAGDRVYAIRHRRDKVARASQSFHEAMFSAPVSGLSLEERLLIAWQVARLSPAPESAGRYRALLEHEPIGSRVRQALSADDIDLLEDPRQRALARFAGTLARRPVEGDRALIGGVAAAGVSTPGIVAAAQLVAYVSWQVRLVAGLIALRAAGDPPADSRAATEAAAVAAAQAVPSAASALAAAASGAAPSAAVLQVGEFTNRPLDWRSWLDRVALERASALQIEVLEESHPKAKSSEYYLTLVHQPEILRQRSIVFNASMYAPGGLSRAERELAATVTSRINRCVYCASVHAQRFEQLARRNDVIAQVFDDPQRAGTTPRERAIIAFSSVLTATPDQVSAQHVRTLREVGLRDDEVLDTLHAVAIFAWANRLMLNLGEPVASAV